MTRRGVPRLALSGLALLALTATASGYYHFVHYPGRFAPYLPMDEKFDLSALANKTVYLYVPDLGPTQYAQGDSFPALLSELRLAARTWNDVDTSDLRVAFGGLFSPGTPALTPHIEVSFDDDIPPGLLAMGGISSRAGVTVGPGGQFVPITGALLRIPRDMSKNPSFSPGFQLTAIHELGHTLGLQHSMASATMSTGDIRATTKARPLAADDIAAISVLYPNARYVAAFGSITGQVSLSGTGVGLASVVALTPTGDAVNALTNPDGTYRIDGLLPGQYYVYAHPLPPGVQQGLGPADIVLPVGPDGHPFAAGSLFQTQFFPGTQDPQQAATVAVNAGAVQGGVNFAVNSSAALQLYGVTTYSFPGSVAVQPAFINMNFTARLFLVAWGPGLVVNQALAPSLRVVALDPTTQVTGVQPYFLDASYAQVSFMFHPFSAPGPRHLVFAQNNDIYVLPSGLNVVNRQPPAINSINPDTDSNGNRVAVITGTNLTADTRILFDGLPAAVVSMDEPNQRMVVTPPPGAGGYRASVVALNSDGQTSQFVQSPVNYQYDPADPPSMVLQTTSLAAGSEAMIEINGINTNFTAGQTRVGFGSSDVVVKRVWVLSPTRLRAEVAVSANATVSATQVSVVSGFQVLSQPFAFQVLPAIAQAVVLGSDLVNAATGQPGAYPGSTAVVSVANLPAGASTLTLTLNDIPVPIVSTGPAQITFQVPATIVPGFAVLQLQTGGDPVPPVLVSIDPAPPVIAAVMGGILNIDASHPARPGDLLTILVMGLSDPGATVAVSRLRINVGGIDQQAAVAAVPTTVQAGMHQVVFFLSPLVPTGQLPMTISIDNRTSQPYLLNVRSL